MNRLSCTMAAIVAMALTSAVHAAELADPPLPEALGEMVDADVPAIYRLPATQLPPLGLVNALPLFPAPLAPTANWLVPSAVCTSNQPEAAAIDPVPAGEVADLEDNLEWWPDRAPETKRVEQPEPPTVVPSVVAQPAEKPAAVRNMVDLNAQLLPAVQRGFGLAQRGALYAARTEFVQVLRRVAEARDAASDTNEYSRALAAGLRAIDEAEDFVPKGVQLEAELDVKTTASSHRTNVLECTEEEISPSEAVERYHVLAQEKLTRAVGGEQAGSMALHGLGTVYARLAARRDEDRQLTRRAMTMYSAALDACPNNHLAANEMGVLVCRSGRPAEAAALFMQAIDFAPSAVAYHNLAIAQQRGGLVEQAAANEMESQRLAAQERARGEVSRRAGVRWVSPDEMARASQPINRTATPASQPGIPPAPPPAKSTWQRFVDSTKSLPLPRGRAKDELGPMSAERVAQPMAPASGNRSQWR